MTRETEHALYALLGIAILSKSSWDVAPALERAGAHLTRQALLQLATDTGFPNPKLAAAVALAESGGVTGAINRSAREYSVGLWQINTMAHPYTADAMKNPQYNAMAAFTISRGGTDWRPWIAYTNGSYRKYLTGVLA